MSQTTKPHFYTEKVLYNNYEETICIFVVRRFCISITCSYFRLVSNQSNCTTVHPGKTHYDVLGVVRHDFKYISIVHRLLEKHEIMWIEVREKVSQLNGYLLCL